MRNATLEHIWHEFAGKLGQFIRARVSDPATAEDIRALAILTKLNGLTHQALADRQGISLSGAKSRVQRGRSQLKQMLNECCTFEFDRRGKVIDCAPRTKAGCDECA